MGDQKIHTNVCGEKFHNIHLLRKSDLKMSSGIEKALRIMSRIGAESDLGWHLNTCHCYCGYCHACHCYYYYYYYYY